MIHLRRIMMVSVVALGVIAAAGHQKPDAQDQRPGPPGTIRIRVRLIPVDVMVTDLNDRPVAGLKQEDFRIFENGREQQIRHFSIEKLTAAAAAPDRPAMLRKVPTLDLAPQNGRSPFSCRAIAELWTSQEGNRGASPVFRSENPPQDHAKVVIIEHGIRRRKQENQSRRDAMSSPPLPVMLYARHHL